jgi:hypothetical protein
LRQVRVLYDRIIPNCPDKFILAKYLASSLYQDSESLDRFRRERNFSFAAIDHQTVDVEPEFSELINTVPIALSHTNPKLKKI